MILSDRISAALSLDGLGDDARAAFELAANAGYGAVAIPTNHPELRPQNLDTSARKHLKRILDSKQLSIATLRIAGPRGGLADSQAIQRIIDNTRQGIALAYDLGITTIAVNAGLLSDSKLDQNSVDSAARLIAEEADRAGLNVAFGADAGDKLAELLKRVGCDRALADVQTAQEIAAGEDPAQIVQRLHGSLAQVTLADAIRSGSHVRSVELGRGQIALPALLEALRESEFLGPIVVDVRDLSDGIHGAQTAAQLLRSCGLADLR